jgi:hypothetical protein
LSHAHVIVSYRRKNLVARSRTVVANHAVKRAEEPPLVCWYVTCVMIAWWWGGGQNIIINDKHCYEMYGYDVMIDAELKPWLIEVNASPSMSSDNEVDTKLKLGLLDDVLTVTDAEGRFRDKPTPKRVRAPP